MQTVQTIKADNDFAVYYRQLQEKFKLDNSLSNMLKELEAASYVQGSVVAYLKDKLKELKSVQVNKPESLFKGSTEPRFALMESLENPQKFKTHLYELNFKEIQIAPYQEKIESLLFLEKGSLSSVEVVAIEGRKIVKGLNVEFTRMYGPSWKQDFIFIQTPTFTATFNALIGVNTSLRLFGIYDNENIEDICSIVTEGDVEMFGMN